MSHAFYHGGSGKTSSRARAPDGLRMCARRFTWENRRAHIGGMKFCNKDSGIMYQASLHYTQGMKGKSIHIPGAKATLPASWVTGFALLNAIFARVKRRISPKSTLIKVISVQLKTKGKVWLTSYYQTVKVGCEKKNVLRNVSQHAVSTLLVTRSMPMNKGFQKGLC